jgi:hypothetical protein
MDWWKFMGQQWNRVMILGTGRKDSETTPLFDARKRYSISLTKAKPFSALHFSGLPPLLPCWPSPLGTWKRRAEEGSREEGDGVEAAMSRCLELDGILPRLDPPRRGRPWCGGSGGRSSGSSEARASWRWVPSSPIRLRLPLRGCAFALSCFSFCLTSSTLFALGVDLELPISYCMQRPTHPIISIKDSFATRRGRGENLFGNSK